MLNFKVKLANKLQLSPQISQGTGGQSRDQSAFENGAMWVRLRVCSVSRQDEWVVEEE